MRPNLADQIGDVIYDEYHVPDVQRRCHGKRTRLVLEELVRDAHDVDKRNEVSKKRKPEMEKIRDAEDQLMHVMFK